MRLARWVIFLIPLVLLSAGEEKNATAGKPKKGRLTIPAEAEKIKPFTYRYKDPAGKTWIYRQTPFGLVRYEETEKPETADDSAPEPVSSTGIKAFEDGDIVRFEKAGPFGKYTWVRKLAELDEQEKKALEESRRKPAEKESNKE